MKLQIYKVEVS